VKSLSEKRMAVSGTAHTARMAGIRQEDLPKILGLLSDRFYSNPIAAVIREYSCNAWDAHVEAGIPDTPFVVSLPNTFVPELVIRDYGTGLSETRVYDTYMMYGASTKEETNVLKGMFGLGSKSAYAYVSAFTIISYFGGEKTTYAAYINAENQRMVVKMATEDSNETGMEIRIPVQREDIPVFKREAARTLHWFLPQPRCEGVKYPAVKQTGIFLEEARTLLLNKAPSSEWSYHSNTSWLVVMGNVAYPFPVEGFIKKLEEEEEEKKEAGSLKKDLTVSGKFLLTRGAGILFLDIGEVTPHPSREALVLDAATKANLTKRVRDLVVKAQERIALSATDSADTSSRQRRASIKSTLFAMSMPIPFELGGLRLRGKVPLPHKMEDPNCPKTFSIKTREYRHSHYSRRVTKLATAEEVSLDQAYTFIIRDCDRVLPRLERYFLGEQVLIVMPMGENYSYDKEELEAFLKTHQLDGERLRLLSSFAPPETTTADERRTTHYSKDIFTFNGVYSSRGSDSWDPAPVSEVPEDALYLNISFFKPDVPLRDIARDQTMFSALLGLEDEMPAIYGTKKPELAGKAEHYLDWRLRHLKAGLKLKSVRRLLRLWGWAGWAPEGLFQITSNTTYVERYEFILKNSSLPASHPLLSFMKRRADAAAAIRQLGPIMKGLVFRFAELIGDSPKLAPAYIRYAKIGDNKAKELIETYIECGRGGAVDLLSTLLVPTWRHDDEELLNALHILKMVDRLKITEKQLAEALKLLEEKS
jgi:hypothetical protein